MAGGGADRASQIFEDVYFAMILSDDFFGEEAEKISTDLTAHGATELDLDSATLHQVTHLIANNVDFPAYHDALEGFIHVVKPSWVKQSVDKGKASNPRQFSPDPRFIFSDVVIHCAEDIPYGDKEAIIGGSHGLGAQYSPKMTKLVTHLVALTKDSPQCQLIFEKRLRCIPVLPHWFDACLRLGKKIDCEPYVIPAEGEPRFFSEKHSDVVPHREATRDLSQSTPDPFAQRGTPPISPSSYRRQLSVFQNRKVMLHEDLHLSDHLRGSIEEIVTRTGGGIVDKLVDANLLICMYRSSKEFVDASMAGKDVGNLNWLYHLINRNRWSDPTSRLLHYPFPEGGVPGFSETKISVSNYQGETRIWLEALVAALGGNFTKSMAQDTTHLVTAHQQSDKCDAAREWNIDMVNHLWLEESYANCELQPLTNRRYTTFPERSNLGEIVGQTQIDRRAIAERHWLTRIPSTPAVAGSEAPDAESWEEDAKATMVAAGTPSANTGKQKRSLHTPALRKLGPAEKTPGSRGAKDRALTKLHDMAPDIALYQKETKRTGGVIYGGRRVTDPDRVKLDDNTRKVSRKRSLSQSETVSDASDSEVEIHDDIRRKRQKQQTKKESVVKVLLSGVGDQVSFRKKAKDFNVRIVESAPADVVVIPKLMRTKKVLCALPDAPTVVKVDWLHAMVKKQEYLPYEDYVLRDLETEANLNLKLDDLLARAKKHKARGGMLKGWNVFATENVQGGFETMRDVVKANGGKCVLFKSRENKIPTPDSGHGTLDDDEGDVEMEERENKENASQQQKRCVLYLASDEVDKVLWKTFQSMAEEKGFKPRVVCSDWLWRICMSQKASEWEEKWKLC